MADHIFGHKYRYVLSAVMNLNRQTNEIGRYHGASGPGLNRSLIIGINGFLDFLHKIKIYKRTLIQASRNLLSPIDWYDDVV